MNGRRKIKSVSWLIEKFSNNNTHPPERYFYRGECEQDGKLVPRLLRSEERYKNYEKLYSCNSGCVVDLQLAILSRFRRYASSQNISDSFNPEAGESPTIDEWLCIAQHHGLPTLLLDWSLHPLIALYFSVRDVSLHDKPGRFWYLKLRNRNNRDDRTVRLRDKSGKKNGILLNWEDSEDNPNKDNKVEHPRVIVPWVFNKRIEAQYARFTYSGKSHIRKSLEEIEDKENPWTTLDWFEVPAGEVKEKIKRDLEKLQIHEKSLFPDMDGLSRYMEGGGI